MALPSTGVYFIQNFGSDTVIDLQDGSPLDGTKVQGFKKHELWENWVPAQLWILSRFGNTNTYTFENANSRTYLDLGDSTNGTPVLGYGGNSSDNQKWLIYAGGKPGTHVIKNKATGTCVDLAGEGNGTKVQGWGGPTLNNLNDHQLWRFIRA